MYAYRAHAMPHMAPLSSPLAPLPLLYGLHICVNYLHVEDQLKEAITQCGIAKPCVLLTTVDHTDLSETSHMSTEPVEPSQSVVWIMSYSASGL